jgi:hypothetical protein
LTFAVREMGKAAGLWAITFAMVMPTITKKTEFAFV